MDAGRMASTATLDKRSSRSQSETSPNGSVVRELTFQSTIPSPLPQSSAYPSPPKPISSPFDWSPSYKAVTAFFCIVLSAIGGMATGTPNPALEILAAEWHVSTTVVLTNTTTYALAFALGPMVLAPFSEIRGRKPIFLACALLYAVSCLGCGFSESLAGFLVARFFSGIASSTFSVMVGGVIADMYRDDDRSTPNAGLTAGIFIGTGLGPLVAALIVYHVDWQWSWYVLTITWFVLSIMTVFLIPETREDIILLQQAKRLNKYQARCEALGCASWSFAHGALNDSLYPQATDVEKRDSSATLTEPSHQASTPPKTLRWYVADSDSSLPLLQSIRISLYRPVHLLVTESIVFWFALWLAFAWAVFYLALAAIESTFISAYGFNTQQVGAIYTAIPVAGLLAFALHLLQEKLRAPPASPADRTPERRLTFTCWESLLFPVGLFWWGWTCRPGIPWIVPAIGLAVVHMGTYAIFLAVLNYTADSYHRFASSALAAQSLTRNVLGAVLPLATQSMLSSLGTGGALSVLGGLALALSAVPFVLLKFGPRIRARSKVAGEMMGNEK